MQDILVESFALRPCSLRVALVTETYPPEVNGVAMTLGRLVEGLVQRGHAVQVVRPRQTREDWPRHHNGVAEVLATGVPIPKYEGLKFGLPSGRRLEALWRQHRPDIVHVATEGPLGWSAVAAARRLKLPVTSSFHTNFHHYSQHYGLSLLKTPIDAYLRKLHNRTQATLVPTQALVEELARKGYSNLQLMSRGVAIDQFNPLRRNPALRAAWGVSADDLVLLYVGRLAKEKNIGLALTAYATIKAHLPSVKMVFVGDGPQRGAIKGLCPEAIFAGMQLGDDLAAHYASADVFLFPSLSETFGNVIPEALASGLGVVAYAQAAAAELINNKVNGCVAKPGDELGFARAALELATSRALLQHVRGHAVSSVSHMAWSSVQDAFLGTLYGVIGSFGGAFEQTHQLLVTPE